MKMKKIIVSLIFGALTHYAHSTELVDIDVQNNLEGSLDPTVYGYESSRPILCVKTSKGTLIISPGQKAVLRGGTPDDNGVLQNWYNADVRLNGCDVARDPYVGYLGIGTNEVKFSSSADLLNRMEIVNAKKTATSITGKLSYIPITENFSKVLHPRTDINRKLTYIGINLSGAEFGKTISPNSMPDLSAADDNSGKKPGLDLVSMYDNRDSNQDRGYIPAGINTVRLPIRWEYLELLTLPSTINEPNWKWNDAYWNAFIAPTLVTLTNAGIHTILDLHSYLHYSPYGTGVSGCLNEIIKCPDGTLDLNKDHYIKVWMDILEKVKANTKIKEENLMFDLINEPAANKKGDTIETLSPQQAFDVEVAVAKQLQANGFAGKILLEGANWTGLHSWNESVDDHAANAVVFTKANLINRGITFNEYSNNVLINVHQYFDDDFSGTKDSCLSNLKSKGKNGFNTAAFAKWLKEQNLKAIVTEFGTSRHAEESCQPILKEFVQYLTRNAVKESDLEGGFVGATLWATGHDWGDYNLLFSPETYQFKTLMNNAITR
ncbi:MAG: putative Cellulase [Solimicrobium sp.]|nr:putative Cellulase [Solimicrobium sp.]